jgi:phosphomannomutase
MKKKKIKAIPKKKEKPKAVSEKPKTVIISSAGRIRKLVEKRIAENPYHSATRKSPANKHDSSSNLMVSVSGIRGIIGNGLTPEIIAKYSAAFGTWANGGTIVVGRDSRVSGELVKTSAIAGLISTGCKVVEIGVVSTPTVEIAVKNLNAHGGIAITASHNPVEWNALKLIGPNGYFLTASQMDEVLEFAHLNNIAYTEWDRLGKVQYYDYAVKDHIERILDVSYLDVEALRKRNLRVVVDCVNGAGGTIVPRLLNELGCEVITINEEPHGIFSRNPEPTIENLHALEHAVIQHKADIGFAVDPDVDRLAIVSNEGKAIGEEYTLAMAVDFVLSKKTGAVVVNASTTMAIDDLAAKYRSKCYRTKIGEINVSTKMNEVHAVIGGEGNGGVILPDTHLGRDAVTGIALILQYILEKERSVPEIIRDLPSYSMKKDKIELGKLDTVKVFDKIMKDYSGEKIDLTDGVKILFSDAWIHFRKSNTEPIVRIIAEAKDKKELNKIIKSFTSYFH